MCDTTLEDESDDAVLTLDDAVLTLGDASPYGESEWWLSPTVVVPHEIKKLDHGAFNGNILLESALLPDGLVEIGSIAFNCCLSLREVMLPNSLVDIGANAFYGCVSLSRKAQED
jgi:hypothetical protein